MILVCWVLAIANTLIIVRAQQSALGSSPRLCHPNSSITVCLDKYAAVLPYPFSREASRNGTDLPQDSFQKTNVPHDPSFSLLQNASFIVFGPERGLSILDYPLTLSNYTPNPPVSGINGGRYYKGLVYWAVSGRKLFSSGTPEEPGIVALNPVANKLTNRLEQLFWYLIQLSQ